MANALSFNMRLLAHHGLQGFGGMGEGMGMQLAGARTGAVPLNDVYVDERRMVYSVDRHSGGLYILEMTH